MLINLILLLLMFVIAVCYFELYKRWQRLMKDLEQSHLDYQALDQGLVELSDAYETDSLQYVSTIEDLKQQIAKFEANNATLIHDANVQRRVRFVLEENTYRFREQCAHLERELDIARTVINEHDQNCLPHIVLSSMEGHEKDTPLPL